MSTATTRRLAKLEQAASGLRTHPVLVAVDQAEAGRLATDHPGALIIFTGAPHTPAGLQA
jgi:hypothetical protein